MIPSINKELESYDNQKNSHICKQRLTLNTQMIKKIVKLEIIVIIHTNTEVLHIEYVFKI